MTDILQLAERCEQAAVPDIQLDADIRDGLGLQHDYRVDWRGWGCDAAGDPTEKPKAFPYTASLDAAMTLVPEGYRLQLSDWDNDSLRSNGPWQAILSKAGSRNQEFDPAFKTRCEHAATPALALCAASLKAKAYQ